MHVTVDQAPARAWRAWNVQDGQLVSPQTLTRWPAGEALHAQHDHEFATKCDGDSCHCGINAVHDPRRLVAEGYLHGQMVLGEVAVWGEVRTHERGLRGEVGYPVRLWATGRSRAHQAAVRLLAEQYGCEYAGQARVRLGAAVWPLAQLERVARLIAERRSLVFAAWMCMAMFSTVTAMAMLMLLGPEILGLWGMLIPYALVLALGVCAMLVQAQRSLRRYVLRRLMRNLSLVHLRLDRCDAQASVPER
jgi:hypothetical protein